MRRIWQVISDGRVLSAVLAVGLATLFWFGTDTLRDVLGTVLIVALALALLSLVVLGVRYAVRKQRGRKLRDAIAPAQESQGDHEGDAVRKSVLDAIDTIKTSRLGLSHGAAALYELPWYMIIGNPAAGKSSAIANSGLHFPIAESKAQQGVGGTRHCDWFFTTEGILLDTAGRYAVYDSDRQEWFSFLDLLKKHRSQAPINGILIAASVAEVASQDAAGAMVLAKKLRGRVQELTDRLGVQTPVYVVFTKLDLVAGFNDFFRDLEPQERERIWGATMRFNRRRGRVDVIGFFEEEFGLLCQGLHEMRLASMAHNRRVTLPPGVFHFPVEFAALKAPLKAFLSAIFDDNAYQIQPVFRGFYFTSAMQEGERPCASAEQVAERFGLEHHLAQGAPAEANAFFLKKLFREVIFADRDLVRRFSHPHRRRMAVAGVALVLLGFGATLGVWTWSYTGNRHLLAQVRADVQQLVRAQEGRDDLQSRLEALDQLQEQITRLAAYRKHTPLSLSWGLFQGQAVEDRLREEFFAGVRPVLLDPVVANLEALLADVNANPDKLSASEARAGGGGTYAQVSAASAEDAYNALKTYLMLSDRSRAEPAHLNDQLTRFWRTWLESNRGAMPREQMIRAAEHIVSFYAAQCHDKRWPQVQGRVTLLDQTRETLRQLARGTPALDRVYAGIKAQAATRYPAFTVAGLLGDRDRGLMQGSASVSGAFTREAWEGAVSGLIKDAARKDLQSTDWVLNTVNHNALSTQGSPEQIQRALLERYKGDYVREWRSFLQGVSVADFANLDAAMQGIGRLADSQASPLAQLLREVVRQTSWDQTAGAERAKLERGLWAWFKESVLRRSPSELRSTVDDVAGGPRRAAASGGVAAEFEPLAKMLMPREKEAVPLASYLEQMARLRARLSQIRNQGDPGPGARLLMQQTLDGSGSELADLLKLVDEQMLAGMSDAQKQSVRPLLVRPLMQTFNAIVAPSEAELNKIWQAQVVQAFQRNLADKYPFAPKAGVEAGAAEIGQIFGPDGAVAKFLTTSMGPLVVRRGDQLAPRTWADIGIRIAPQTLAGFPSWLAPLANQGVATPTEPQTLFQILPQASPGVASFTIEIDGQTVQYRPGVATSWASLVHPAAQGVPGARITAVSSEGRAVEVLNEPGQYGLKRMIDSASRTRKDNGVFGLQWRTANVVVNLDLKIVSSADANGRGDSASGRGFLGMRLPDQVAGPAAPALAGTP